MHDERKEIRTVDLGVCTCETRVVVHRNLILLVVIPIVSVRVILAWAWHKTATVLSNAKQQYY